VPDTLLSGGASTFLLNPPLTGGNSMLHKKTGKVAQKEQNKICRRALFICLDSLVSDAGVDVSAMDWKKTVSALMKKAGLFKPGLFVVFYSPLDMRQRTAAKNLEHQGGRAIVISSPNETEVLLSHITEWGEENKNASVNAAASGVVVCGWGGIVPRLEKLSGKHGIRGFDVFIPFHESSVKSPRTTEDMVESEPGCDSEFFFLKAVPCSKTTPEQSFEIHMLSPNERIDRCALDFASGLQEKYGAVVASGVAKGVSREFGFSENAVRDRITKMLKDGFLENTDPESRQLVFRVNPRGLSRLELLETGYE